MKKILFVTETLNLGGMEKEQVALANALARRGCDVTIVTYRETFADGLTGDLDPAVHFRYVAKKEFPEFLMKHKFTRQYVKGDEYEKRQSPRELWNYYVGRNEKFDVEIAFYRGPSVKIVSGSPNGNALKIAWAHTDYKLCDPKSLTKFFASFDECRAAYAAFDRIVCVSRKACESFAEVIGYKDKLTTVYNMLPIDTIREKMAEPCPFVKKNFTFVTVGRLIEAKGYDRLLECVRRLNADGYDFTLRIVGYGRCEEQLKAFAEENGLANVVFEGKQSNPYKYLRSSDCFVCSSLREGFSIVVAEALCCGLPVISTDCTGPVEILGNGEYGFIVPGETEAIYKKMKEVLDDPAVLVPFAEKAEKRAEYFGEDRITEQVIDLIEGSR